MGTFKASVGISNGNGGDVLWTDALVDTGASYTVLPDFLLRDEVGISPKGRIPIVYADGRELLMPFGEARVHVEGREFTTRVVVGEGDECLLGATTLQELVLMPDTNNHKLIPAPSARI